MIKKKTCVAMLLAGGQGSRLYVLTTNVAKPAVPFGGKYRIIDFPLSNCINSGIDTVGVLTQYEPLQLNSYIGNGHAWDLDRMSGGVHILPPYMRHKSGEWYTGTANAIYQNIPFIEQYDPEYVLILSGDHIYRMDYTKMIAYHAEKNADCTISVINVSLEEASRFGIMNTTSDGVIYEFEEKPKEPKSTLASMGIYVFNWEKLRKYLEEDEANKESSNDFGKNIIPTMLANGEKMVAYEFEGYWKDVGTIDSLWDANMDMLAPNSGLNIDDPDWRIYTRNLALPPHYISPEGRSSHSMVAEGCEIEGCVEDSVLFGGVKVGRGAKVLYSVLMNGVEIEEGATVEFSIIAENTKVGKNATIGSDEEIGKITVLAANIEIGDGVTVNAGDMVAENIGGGQ
ncbi:MAG: glucose-1-phosphate adenylyltransferase [Clostridiales bacterium]|jgi:glucose-1-phosphate adenylyltransferase|nr:glucose-1-phosphate adenylyltransferase [Clostridiales bacterium]